MVCTSSGSEHQGVFLLRVEVLFFSNKVVFLLHARVFRFGQDCFAHRSVFFPHQGGLF